MCHDRNCSVSVETMTNKVRQIDVPEMLWKVIIDFSKKEYYVEGNGAGNHGSTKNRGIPKIIKGVFIDFMVNALYCEERIAKRIASIAIS